PIMQTLLQQDGALALINQVTECGETPLHRAIRSNHLLMFEFLSKINIIEYNSKIRIGFYAGSTPLNSAIQNRNIHIVKHLLKIPGININASRNPLLIALENPLTNIIIALCEYDPELINREDDTN